MSVDRPKAKSTPTELQLSVVGMLYHVTPKTLSVMAEDAPLKVKLVREPHNTHDENAIAVYVTEKPYEGFQIGYVARVVASEIAPRLDDGRLEVTEAWLHVIEADEGKGEMVVEGLKRKSLQKGNS